MGAASPLFAGLGDRTVKIEKSQAIPRLDKNHSTT
jgi:hypothetical protein